MTESDERAVAQLIVELLSVDPVTIFNDSTRLYTFDPAPGVAGVDAYYFFPANSPHNQAERFELHVIKAAGATPERVEFQEITGGVSGGRWIASAPFWVVSESDPSPGPAAPPVIPEGFFSFFPPVVSGLEQIAIAGDDADLQLPAAVVSAIFEEEARALKKNGNYGGRYRVDIELRGIRTTPGTTSLDAILRQIEDALNFRPYPLPAGAAAFSYFFIDERLGNENKTGEETRELGRSYSVFALLT